MSRELQQLIYFSKAVKLMSEAELQLLLDQCRERNKRFGLTGMLLYIETSLYGGLQGRFIQAIEGPREALLQTFTHIEADNRHRNITVLQERPIRSRDFSDWSMGFLSTNAGSGDDNTLLCEQLFAQQTPGLNIPMNYLKSFYTLRNT